MGRLATSYFSLPKRGNECYIASGSELIPEPSSRITGVKSEPSQPSAPDAIELACMRAVKPSLLSTC